MSPGLSNRHHGIPRSFTGSNDRKTNITVVDQQNHADFHQVAGHVPPDFFIRKILLSSVDWQNDAQHSLPIGFYHDVIAALFNADWRAPYHDTALRTPQQNKSDEEFFARCAVHIYNHISAETYQAADALKYVREGAHISPQSRGYLAGVGDFFGEQNPAIIIHRFLLDTSARGELKWTKPLLPNVHSYLVQAAEMASTPEPMHTNEKKELEELMMDYRESIASCLNVWEPTTDAYSSIINRRKHEYFYQQFLQRSA